MRKKDRCPRDHAPNFRYHGINKTCRDCDRERSARRYLTPERKEYHRKHGELFYYRKRELIVRGKMKPCCDCGIQYNPWVMEYDHRNPEDKKFVLSRGTTHSEEDVIKEIEKCDVVCANCHAERTHKQGRYKMRIYPKSNYPVINS